MVTYLIIKVRTSILSILDAKKMSMSIIPNLYRLYTSSRFRDIKLVYFPRLRITSLVYVR